MQTTTLELDTQLVQKIAKDSGETSEAAAVEAALRFAMQMRAQRALLELRGKVEWDGDLQEMRRTRYPDWDQL